MSRKNEIVAEEVSERKALWAAVRRAEPIQQVRRLMREKQLLSKDLAMRMGVTEAGISRLLKGNQNIQIDTLFMLADALESPLSIDFGDKDSSVTYSFDDECVSSYFDDAEGIWAGGSNVVQLQSYRKYNSQVKQPKSSSTFALECAN